METPDRAGETFTPRHAESIIERAEAISDLTEIITSIQAEDDEVWGFALSPKGTGYFGSPGNVYGMMLMLTAAIRSMQHKLETEKAIDWAVPMGQEWWHVQSKLDVLQDQTISVVFEARPELWKKACNVWYAHDDLCRKRNELRGKSYGSLVEISDIVLYMTEYGNQPSAEWLDETHFQRVKWE